VIRSWWIKKMQYVCSREFNSAIKKKEENEGKIVRSCISWHSFSWKNFIEQLLTYVIL
jgi:hypothetical protein